ncbi:T9SS type A sorting domain-containing protein [bacterium SCSIO 12643]|nr:T9SS type A sorting domain-containing protein [bacterium SCSIO 12643]
MLLSGVSISGKSQSVDSILVQPNPVKDTLSIYLELNMNDSVSISSYSLATPLKDTLCADSVLYAGNHTIKYDVTNFLNGSYILTLEFKYNQKANFRFAKTDTLLSVKENSLNDEAVFYPNPTTGRVYFEDIKENTTIQVLDLRGQLIQEVNSSQGYFDFENVPSGVYVVRYYDFEREEFKINVLEMIGN